MDAILHGTWVMDDSGRAEEVFFVWAERKTPPARSGGRVPRIRRHPCAATTIEIAQLLSYYVPEEAWRSAERLTRVALLPSWEDTPILPAWLVSDQAEIAESAVKFAFWRIEGIGIPILRMLDVLAALPLREGVPQNGYRVGVDLRFWSLAAKFTLELLAGQRFIPGIRSNEQDLDATWLPVLDAPHDKERFSALAAGMPPICRSVFREHGEMDASQSPKAQLVLQSFVTQLVNQAVRSWGGEAARHDQRKPTIASAWWQALWSDNSRLAVTPAKQRELTRFYQAWQSWTYRTHTEPGSGFSICLRLEPPDYEKGSAEDHSQWVLRYFIQANDDPSLLVPANEVWLERGRVLSYLSHNFDQPQEKLLEGLGLAARLCPAIQRSLRNECPELAILSAEEAYGFLRETSRLLEGIGISVLVPPWWSKPDARLRVRLKMHAPTDAQGSGFLGMESLVSYDWELALGDELITRDEFERLAALKAPLVQMRGRWVLLQPDQVEAAISFWEKQQARGEMALHDALALAIGAEDEVDGLPVGDIELDPWLSDLVNTFTGSEPMQPIATPQSFVGTLRPYQEKGVAWLAFLGHWGLGACLADDMGLGKTIQAIALLLHAQEHDPHLAPTLLICPTSLVGNWQREVTRFAPGMRVLVHHGSNRAEGAELEAQVSAVDLVISTYGLARRDVQDLMRVRWSHIILDEAQNVKNPVTKQARAIRRLWGQHRIVLTGTPIENRLSELWSLMSFLNPGYLGTLEAFRRTFAVPIERFQDEEGSQRLRKMVRPFILRRLKTDPQVIQDLPEKFEYKVYCNLTREQVTLYEAVVQASLVDLQQPDLPQDAIKRRGMILAMLTRLKQICDHPALYLGDGSSLASRSGKLNRLDEMLEEVMSVNERALVFTQYAQMGHLLQRHLMDTFHREVLFLYGGTPQLQRDKMVLRFQNDAEAPAIFVLSLKAGGTGLNLMRANHVFHFDRWWNPAVENQATDRAFRIGQDKDVQVHKLIAVGTLEDRIDLLIESKRALAESVVGAGEDWLSDLSTDALRDLVALRTEALETEPDEQEKR
ncbi:MAG: DEAD/DEAH box helicase [Anaerolineae bacterium]